MAQTLPTSEVLHLAADAIERDGWWHPDRLARGKAQPLCASNAIVKAAGVPYCGAHVALVAYLSGTAAGPVRTIFDWNDAPGRTAAEVIEVLRATAAIEASREDAALLAEIGRA